MSKRSLLLLPFVAIAGGCSTVPVPKPHETGPTRSAHAVDPVALASAACTAPARSAAVEGVGDTRRGSALVVYRAEGKRFALAADHDAHAIHTVDLDAAAVVARTDVRGAPREMVLFADGRLAVTLDDQSSILVLTLPEDAAAPLAGLCSRPMPSMPWGLAVTRDDRDLVATSGWDSSLVMFDAATFDVKHALPLPRSARGVLVDDQRRAYVAHIAGGDVSVVDLDRERLQAEAVTLGVKKRASKTKEIDRDVIRSGVQSYALASATIGGRPRPKRERSAPPPKTTEPPPAGEVSADAPPKPIERIFVPMVSADPGDETRKTSIYYGPPSDDVPKEAAHMGVIDPTSVRKLGAYLLATNETQPRERCLLPRAIASNDAAGTLLVACLGVDSLLALDAFAVDPFAAEVWRVRMPEGPVGVVLDAERDEAIVLSQFEPTVSVVSLDGRGIVSAVELDYVPFSPTWLAGRSHFYRTGDGRVANDGMSCASCHPDGLEDGLTWQTPDGPRQTLMLAGRLEGTAPYGWTRGEASLDSYIHSTIERLGGSGVGKDEQKAIATYVQSLQPPSQRAPEDRTLVEQGREIFFRADVGCATCHVLAKGVDGRQHPIAGQPTDTPSLVGVSGTAPYFHDGRYSTLMDVLEDPRSSMGHPQELSRNDRLALLGYLQSL